MNGFLVLARCELDDVPMGLFATNAEAGAHAETLTPEDVFRVAREVMQLDTSVLHCISVVEFEGGKPLDCVMVVDFTDDAEGGQ